MRSTRRSTEWIAVGRPAFRALTLAEAIVAMAIISVMLVAGLEAVGTVRATQATMHDRQTGALLAHALLAEISSLRYADPDDGESSLGPEADETIGVRSTYDDIDDYSAWDASPPRDSNDEVMKELDGWRRVATVQWVSLAAPNTTAGSATGLKRIAVAVYHGPKPVSVLFAWRAESVDTERLE